MLSPFCSDTNDAAWAPRLLRLAPRSARKLPGRIEGQFGLDREVAALVVADEGLAALAGPFDRTADPPRGPRQQRKFGIEEIAGAEIAAHVAADDPHLSRVRPSTCARRRGLRDAAAAAGVQRVIARRGIVLRDRWCAVPSAPR